jgi:polysaccharide export outer membrane protein
MLALSAHPATPAAFVGQRLAAMAALMLAAALGAACGSSQPVVVEEAAAEPPDTTLGPEDVFDVRVFGEKELSSTYRVASDGTIDFPLIGTVSVTGKTPTEVADLIETELVEGDFLKRPQVSILVTEYNSKKISVFGQVKQPGTFPYQDDMSVVEAISKAGGFTSMARANDTVVIRVVEGDEKRFKVQVEAIGEGRAPNFLLRAGDIVFVPERVF